LAGPLPPLAIPATLHDSLIARLDRLAPVKEIAQISAAIGREFSHALLAAVADRTEAELAAAVDQLVASELVFRSRTSPEATYTFKHALVQDAAYGTLLKARRQHLHARIAKTLEQRFADMVDKQPEVLAHHSTQAGFLEKAVHYWHRAGQLAIARSAISEAIAQLTTGLEVLRGLPDSEERARRELDLQVALGDALRSAKRYGDELDLAYRRARELCEQLGEISRLIQVVYGQNAITFNAPNVPAAAKFADELLRIACEHRNSAASVLGEQASGNACFARGNFSAARLHLDRALASSHRVDLAHAQYPALSLTYLSSALFLLGFPDQSRDRCEQALAEAGQAPPLTLALTLDNAITFEVLRRDEQAVREHADTLSSLAAEMENAFFLDVAKFAQGWTVSRRDQISEGITLMREGMKAIWASGMQVQAPYQLAQLAEAYARIGDTREGLECIGEAFARAEETGERWYDSELVRLKGDLLAGASPASAEACFRRGIEIAREQDAKMWELRAAMSLARLWRDQGKRAEARDLLAPIYGWFTEGFDTADLKDAKALLDELA
jgi:predicted ATPase